MSADILEAEMEIPCDERGKMNPKMCVAAGVKTQIADKNQFQRRHFSDKMSSNIFFCDGNKSSGNSVEEDLNMPAEIETSNDEENQSEKQDFHLPSENGAEEEEQEQVDSASAEIIESTENEAENADENESERRHEHLTSEDSVDQESTETESNLEEQSKTQRRHFQDKMKSNIFFSG